MSAFASEPAQLKSFEIVRIPESEAPRIDGVLDEAAWQKAVQVKDLAQWFPQSGDAAEPSIFSVMYDKDALYIGARLVIDSGPNQEIISVTAVTPSTNSFTADFTFAHPAGADVRRVHGEWIP